MMTANDIKEELNRRIADHEALLEAWQKVERQTKKDGSDFSVLSKNFKNAIVRVAPYSLRHNMEVRVMCTDKNNYWHEENIDCTQMVRYSKRKVDESRIIHEDMWEDRYDLTIDEIFEEIEQTIAKHKGRIEELNSQLEMVDKYYALINDKLQEIESILNDLALNRTDSENLDLRYRFEDMVHRYVFK